MIRFLALGEILEIYVRVMARTGGAVGIRDIEALKSALAQPRMTFGGRDLYPTLVEKAAVLGFALIHNHPFIDGNKRVGHAAMEVFLLLNGFEIEAPAEEQEAIILRVAAGELSRQEFSEWLKSRIAPSSFSNP